MEVKYDQHFLKSENTLKLEANIANINEKDIILEVGPGDGRLSKYILQKNPKKLIALEMDKTLEVNLKKLKEEYNNQFEYLICNALNEINNIKFDKLISNIPYSITETLYEKILNKKIKFLILLQGINFYKITIDKNTKWHYLINAFYNIELIKEIPGNAFEPEAKTMSVLIKLELKNNKQLNKENLFLQRLYSKKERNILNALIYTFVDLKKTKKEAKKIISKLKLSQRTKIKKFNNISNNEFINIIKNLKY